jgi:hypothetical protein
MDRKTVSIGVLRDQQQLALAYVLESAANQRVITRFHKIIPGNSANLPRRSQR